MTAPPDDAVVVVDAPDRQRYEARLGDQVAGFIEYRAVSGRIILIHTRVEPEFEGRGIGARLAAGALDDIRVRRLKVTVKCPFVAAYMARHPEYQDLRAEDAAPADADR